MNINETINEIINVQLMIINVQLMIINVQLMIINVQLMIINVQNKARSAPKLKR